MADTIAAIAAVDVPVMGHVGLTPQSVHRMGGFVVQGREEEQARAIFRDAQALERAGCYALVLEGIPKELARDITASLHIPTIGIGAGIDCDGQVLVSHDLLGLSSWVPRFGKRYAELATDVVRATRAFVDEVRGGRFPTEAHAFQPAPPVAVNEK